MEVRRIKMVGEGRFEVRRGEYGRKERGVWKGGKGSMEERSMNVWKEGEGVWKGGE